MNSKAPTDGTVSIMDKTREAFISAALCFLGTHMHDEISEKALEMCDTAAENLKAGIAGEPIDFSKYTISGVDMAEEPNETKFEVGSVWYDKVTKAVCRITDGCGYAETLYYRDAYCIGTRTIIHQPSDRIIPFYAPPEQEVLDSIGMEIDRIDVVNIGDSFISCFEGSDGVWKARGYLIRNGIDDGYSDIFDGLRYILKDKEPEKSRWITWKEGRELFRNTLRDNFIKAINKAEIPNKTTVAAIEESREIDKDSETENMWVISRNPEEVDIEWIRENATHITVSDDKYIRVHFCNVEGWRI